MKSVVLDPPMFGFIVATRAALGFGVGLLIAGRLPAARRRALGRLFVTIGALTTIPAARALAGSLRNRRNRAADWSTVGLSTVGHDARMVGAERFPRKGDDDFM
jgi:hypothetical protein